MRFGVGDENLSASLKHLKETLGHSEVKITKIRNLKFQIY